MEPEQIYWIAGIFAFACLFSRRPTVAVEEEFEDSEVDEELMDDLLNDLRQYAAIAKEVSVKRANGDVIEVKFRGDEPPKVVHNVPVATEPQGNKLVWSQDGRSLVRETWGEGH